MGLFDSWKVDVKTYLKFPVVFPGNVVEGYVEIQPKSQIEFVAVRVKLTGKEKITVQRMVDTGRRDEQNRPIREKRSYSESTVVYKQLVTLAGVMKQMNSRHSQQMPPGRWTYPFAIQLPNELPPSFCQRASDDYAEIQYYVKAYVDIPMGRDAVHKSHFTVLKPIPMTQWQQANPVSVDRYFDVTCCCCISKGKVNARMYMDRTVIAMDRDNLTVCCAVDNTNGKEPVEGIEFSLFNNLTYTVRTPWTNVTEKNRVRQGHNFIKQTIPPGQRGTIQGVIPLPRTITPSLRTWHVTSEYSVTLELNIPWASDPKHTFPVIVAQSVDDSNRSPPLMFQECAFRSMPKGQCPEFFYQPPPQPVYTYQPIPTMGSPMSPPSQSFVQYNHQSGGMPLPAMNGWSAPTQYGEQTHNANVQWNSGFDQARQQMPASPHHGAGNYSTMNNQQQPSPMAGGNAMNQPLLL